MNAQRRKEIEKACEQFNILDNTAAETKSGFEDLREELSRLRDEEEEYKDNMPENLQGSDKYAAAESVIEELDSLISGIDDLVQSLENMPSADDVLNVI